MKQKDLGARIRARREALGISQQKLADALGLHQNKISLIEQGKRRIDPVKHLPLLTKQLQVPLNWFYEDFDIEMSASPLQGLLKQYFPKRRFTKDEELRIELFIDAALPALVDALSPKTAKKPQPRKRVISKI